MIKYIIDIALILAIVILLLMLSNQTMSGSTIINSIPTVGQFTPTPTNTATKIPTPIRTIIVTLQPLPTKTPIPEKAVCKLKQETVNNIYH